MTMIMMLMLMLKRGEERESHTKPFYSGQSDAKFELEHNHRRSPCRRVDSRRVGFSTGISRVPKLSSFTDEPTRTGDDYIDFVQQSKR